MYFFSPDKKLVNTILKIYFRLKNKYVYIYIRIYSEKYRETKYALHSDYYTRKYTNVCFIKYTNNNNNIRWVSAARRLFTRHLSTFQPFGRANLSRPALYNIPVRSPRISSPQLSAFIAFNPHTHTSICVCIVRKRELVERKVFSSALYQSPNDLILPTPDDDSR